jgi:hypothetical protein
VERGRKKKGVELQSEAEEIALTFMLCCIDLREDDDDVSWSGKGSVEDVLLFMFLEGSVEDVLLFMILEGSVEDVCFCG